MGFWRKRSLGCSSQGMILVIDGDQALKKRGTALEREHIRTKALDRTTANLDTLETRIATGKND
jgi:hypothetical protein